MPIDRTKYVLTVPDQHTPNTGELATLSVGVDQDPPHGLVTEVVFSGRTNLAGFERAATDRERTRYLKQAALAAEAVLGRVEFIRLRDARNAVRAGGTQAEIVQAIDDGFTACIELFRIVKAEFDA